MLNLAVTNFLVCLILMPLSIVSGFAGEFIFGKSDHVRCQVCKIGVLYAQLLSVSLHTLAAISIDRLLYLKWPLKYSNMITSRHVLVAIAGIWTLCTLIGIPPLFGFGEITFEFRIATCLPSLDGSTHIAPNYLYAAVTLAEALVIVIIILTTYVWILCIARNSFVRSQKRREVVVNGSSSTRPYCRVQIQLVKTLLAIISVNLVTWIPPICLVTLEVANSNGLASPAFYTIAFVVYLSQTLLHPILELYLLPGIRSAVFKRKQSPSSKSASV